MKRLFVALCALCLSIIVAFGDPGLANAASPPPPCPNGETFIICVYECPIYWEMEESCLGYAGNPPNCRVENPFCQDLGNWDCDGFENHHQLWCPFRSTL
jgi:hypothetical protein